MRTGLMVFLPEGTSAETHLKFPSGTRYIARFTLDRIQTEEDEDGVPLGHRVTNSRRS